MVSRCATPHQFLEIDQSPTRAAIALQMPTDRIAEEETTLPARAFFGRD
ncbi:MAG: hypothetical protein AAFY09_06500 [Pseudomonadota bacterium]